MSSQSPNLWRFSTTYSVGLSVLVSCCIDYEWFSVSHRNSRVLVSKINRTALADLLCFNGLNVTSRRQKRKTQEWEYQGHENTMVRVWNEIYAVLAINTSTYVRVYYVYDILVNGRTSSSSNPIFCMIRRYHHCKIYDVTEYTSYLLIFLQRYLHWRGKSM